jgi:hypothetical protein
MGESATPSKTDREVIYDSFIYTVESNLQYLNPRDIKLMATRNMAFALLAKLYINAEVYSGTAQWEKAGQYCDSVIAGPYSFVNDVNSPFATNNENNSEIIFSIPL